MNDGFEIVGDDAREARIVAVLLGEASDFEREEMERLCEDHPELRIFRRRMETLHGLLDDSEKPIEAGSPVWKLSKERRAVVLDKLGEKKAVVGGPKKRRPVVQPIVWQVAACAAVLVLFLGISVSTVGLSKRGMAKVDSAMEVPAAPATTVSELAVLEEMTDGSGLVASTPRKESLARYRQTSEEPFAAEQPLPASIKVEEAPVTPYRKPSAPASTMSRAIAANTASPTAVTVPVPGQEAPKPDMNFDSGADFGTGWGSRELALRIDPVESNELALGRRAIQRENVELEFGDEARSSAVERFGENQLERVAQDFAVENERHWAYQGKNQEAAGSVDAFAADGGLGYFFEPSLEGEVGKLPPALAGAKMEGVAGNELQVRTFKVPSTFMSDLAGQIDNESDADPFASDEESTVRGLSARRSATQILEESGITFPEGASAGYNASTGELIVKNSAENVELLEQITDELGSVPSGQIGVRTKFSQVEQDNQTALGRDWVVEPFGFTAGKDARRGGVGGRTSGNEKNGLMAGDAWDNVLPALDDIDLKEAEVGLDLAKKTGRFDDSIRMNPSLTVDHSERVDEIGRLLHQGEGFYNLADYDSSENRFQKVLQLDPYNKAARRWLERNAAIKSDYYRAAYDQTRAGLLMEVDKAWELAIPSASSAKNPSDELGLMSSLFKGKEPSENSQSRESVHASELPAGIETGFLPSLDSEEDGSKAIANKLQNLVIPAIDFENVPLEQALEFLTQQSIELDSESGLSQKGVNFTIERGSFSEASLAGGLLLGDSPVDEEIDVLTLRNVPLSTALEYIANKVGLRYRVDGYGVTLLPTSPEASANLVTRTWAISPETYAKLMESPEEDVFVAEQEEVSSEQEALENSGVSFPDDASVRYSPENGVLIVRNSVPELNLVDQLLEKVGEQSRIQEETLAMGEKDAATQADSTFSLHVSDVSFKLAKAALEQGKWPETVRVEEFVNAFSYGERRLAPSERVGVAMEQAAHPALSQRNLLRMSLQTAATGRGAGVPLRLTVVLDKSGSMDRLDRAAAVDEAFRVLVEQLNPGDKVTLVGFSRTPSLLADFVDGAEAGRLLQILRETPSEGGTNVEEALGLALAKALEHYETGAQNRVILLTDGIANLGESVPESLMAMVEGMRKEGVAFDACGVGVEGVNDEILEALTRKGDGRYYLLGSAEESGADFARQVAGALRPAAQNVKVQVEWNPARVGKWRLYGFEKHELQKEDFRNDSVDAAEMAAEEEGVALYHVEVKPDGEGPLGVARVRFLDVANDEMVEREWEIAYEGEAAPLTEADAKVRLAGVAGLTAEKLAKSAVGERVEWDDLLETTRQLKSVFPKEERVRDLERMIEQAKNLE